MTRFDVAVVGLGAMGSAAAWHLAARGLHVVGVEQYGPDHALGSSHGASRIFRLAYEQDEYVRLAVEALPLWRRLEQQADTQILDQTGSVDFGNAEALGRIAKAMRRNDVACQLLEADAARRRWPGIRFTGAVLHSPDGGRTDADAARASLQRVAGHLGAQLQFNTAVRAVAQGPGGVVIETDAGAIEADVAVITVNAWVSALLGDSVALPTIRVTQEQPAFFRAIDPTTVWPSFIHYVGAATLASDFGCYGLDSPGEGGVKVGEHGTGVVVDPNAARPRVDPARLERLQRYVAANLPGLDPEPLSAVPCLYATTPSEDFILDRVGDIVIGAGFSGHGFKFVPAVGRLLADLAQGTAAAPRRFSLPR